jgi:hypothetical protein
MFCIYTSPQNTGLDGRFAVTHNIVQGLYSYNAILNHCRGFRGQLEDHQQDGDPHRPYWARIAREFLDMHFPRRWVGRGLRAHPISRRLIPSCGDTLRTCLQDPCDLPHELKLRFVAATETATPPMLEAGEHLRGKLNPACTSHVPGKARMLKLLSIPQYWFYK